MLRRTRTTKKLARRIDLQYFARPHAFRRWRFWLSMAIPFLALGWLLTQVLQGGQTIYSSGPLASAHAVFTRQCGLCHVTRAGAFFRDVRDEACQSCHDGPIHHSNQRFTPTCSSCHTEHKGATRLAATSNASCTQCHAKLLTKDGQPHFAVAVSSFDSNHPEFSVLAQGKTDEGKIRLNHYLHLQPLLIGPGNNRVQLTCDECHRTSSSDSLPYAAMFHPVAGSSEPSPRGEGANMVPIRFADHCGGCHLLHFDKHFGDEQVPHDKPQVIHTFLLKRFAEYAAAHPGVVHEVETPSRQMPQDARIPRVARSPAEWVQFRTADAEWLLWTKTCRQCHLINPTNGAPPPEVAPSNISRRWLKHAEFDHRPHRMMSCTACHSRALESHDTSDILLPGIETCRQCHREDGPSKEVAEGRCRECHQYHDWSQAKRTKGRFNIPELRGAAD